MSKEDDAARLAGRAAMLWRRIMISNNPRKFLLPLSRIDEAREREGIEPETGMTEVQIFNAIHR